MIKLLRSVIVQKGFPLTSVTSLPTQNSELTRELGYLYRSGVVLPLKNPSHNKSNRYETSLTRLHSLSWIGVPAHFWVGFPNSIKSGYYFPHETDCNLYTFTREGTKQMRKQILPLWFGTIDSHPGVMLRSVLNQLQKILTLHWFALGFHHLSPDAHQHKGRALHNNSTHPFLWAAIAAAWLWPNAGSKCSLQNRLGAVPGTHSLASSKGIYLHALRLLHNANQSMLSREYIKSNI